MRRAATGLALALLAAATAVAQGEQCGVCHPQSRVAFDGSIHQGEGVACSDCHGGDPASRELRRAHGGDFRALDDRLQVPALCAECHADLERMRPYNLPVDQYAVYLTSQHGRAIGRGERRAAICSDCHGAHAVLRPSDTDSPVHPRRLADTCGSCHADPELAAEFGLDPRVVEEYRSGVHGQSLAEGGTTAAAGCTSCHGVHGAAPPGFGDVDKVCGGCHVQERRAYLDGPHHAAMRDAGLPECASCHEHHATRRLAPDAIEAMCSDCHGAESEQAREGERIEVVLRTAADEIAAAERLTTQAARTAVHVEDYLSRLEEARTYLTEGLTLVHTVRLASVEEMTRRARSIGEEVQHEIYQKIDRRPAHIGLVLFWFYLVMTVLVITVYKRRLRASGG